MEDKWVRLGCWLVGRIRGNFILASIFDVVFPYLHSPLFHLIQTQWDSYLFSGFG